MADTKISALTGATTPLSGTEVLPIVQSGSTVKVANNDLRPKQIQSNSTSGVLQVSGPAAAATRVMTVPDANFTAARTDAAQTFSGNQRINGNIGVQTTASTTAATDVSVDLGGTNSAQVTGLINFSLAKGVTWDGSNWKYTTGYADAKVFALSFSSGYVWYHAPVGSAGATASFTSLATLNNSGDFTPIGNLVQGTAGKGVNFTANTPAAGMTSQLLNWYEEGTWTPTQGAGLTVVGAFSSSGKYTRIGRLVTVTFTLTAATSIAATGVVELFAGLPYAGSGVSGFGVGCNASGGVTYNFQISASSGYLEGSNIAATNNVFGSVTYSIS